MNKEQSEAYNQLYTDFEEYRSRNDIMIPLEELSNPKMYEYWEKENVLNIILEHIYVCLNGIRYKHHNWGIGCGECDICISRKKAYEEYMNKKYNQ